MALIRCNECGGKVSDSAKVCPHCGKTVDVDECIMDEAIKKSGWYQKKKIIILVCIVVFVIVGCFFVRYMRIKGDETQRQRHSQWFRELYEKEQSGEIETNFTE